MGVDGTGSAEAGETAGTGTTPGGASGASRKTNFNCATPAEGEAES